MYLNRQHSDSTVAAESYISYIQFNSIYLHSIDPARITIVLTDVEIVIISIN